MIKRVLVPLAEGFEEIEAITIIDVLRRAGVRVDVASLGEKYVRGSHEITVRADFSIDEARAADYDLIALPGGMPGTLHLREDPRVLRLLGEMDAAEKPVAALCAAPSVLAGAGILKDRRATVHPSVASFLTDAKIQDARVVRDGRIVTGKAAGAAMEFAFALVEWLLGPEKVEEVNRSMFARL
jgi:4-methyl-5(b-hydroxyethyl)-thiazole monophosphate biosynthesis